MTGRPSRKTFLGSIVALPALAGIAVAIPARADASKSSQASMHYQTTPNDGKQCSACTFFIPGSATSNGSCKIVEGSISSTGYCIAFTPKH